MLLLIGAGEREFREYLLAAIAQEHRVHLLTGGEPDWERAYLAGWTRFDPAETIAADELCAAARALAATAPVTAVLSWDEARVLQAAKVAAALDLPGGTPDAVLNCRDKLRTRQALAAAGIPQPEWAPAATGEEAAPAAARIGYPVVLKPRALAASLGVVRADTPFQLAEAFRFARTATVPGAWEYDTAVLVEELLTGPEVSVDAAVHRGEVFPMFVARKEVGYPPYFEEVGHLVDAADPLLTDPAVGRLLRETHRALGITDGVTHTELKLTGPGAEAPAETPPVAKVVAKVIEVNARLGGDLIPYLGRLATGIDPGLAAAAVAAGRPPALTPDRARVAGIRFGYPAVPDTTVGEVHIDRSALPAEVTEVVPLVPPGTVVSPPPAGLGWGRTSYAVAVADTAAGCRAALDAAEAAVTLRPPPPAPGR